MKEPIKFEWRGNHHGYYGIFLVVFGLFNYYMSIDNGELSNLGWLWLSATGLGAFCIIDDLVEHLVTRDTPLRLIFRLLYKIKE